MIKFIFLLQVLLVPVTWGNLLINGGFEEPHFTSPTSESFPAGSTDITGWLVVPFAPADVSLLNDNFTIGNLTFLPHSGSQSINLTGNISGEAAGVQQNVKLQVGHQYEVTFWVGNQDNSAQNFMLDARVGLTINNNLVNFYTNSDSSHHALNWKEFSYDFIATQTANQITFQNFTVPNEDYIGLDDANLVDITTTSDTPEPGCLLLATTALMMAGWRRRKSNRCNHPGQGRQTEVSKTTS